MHSSAPVVEAIIFDIGNVLIDIDYQAMVDAFIRIAKSDFKGLVSYTRQDDIFDRFERGEVTAAVFRDTLRPYLLDGVTDAQIDTAWNAILIDYPLARLDMLTQLASHYRIYALSNINQIHLAHIDAHIQQATGRADFKSYFTHAFYSHEIGMRKPEARIYQHVAAQIGLPVRSLLFIDDKLENTDAAASQGWQVHHLDDRQQILPLTNRFFANMS
jgi:glucose-1-phosphatase